MLFAFRDPARIRRELFEEAADAFFGFAAPRLDRVRCRASRTRSASISRMRADWCRTVASWPAASSRWLARLPFDVPEAVVHVRESGIDRGEQRLDLVPAERSARRARLALGSECFIDRSNAEPNVSRY